eukprot:TRINITY_DN289_c0_g5_i1.p1 TRINITY_DN289_c0_g5~~TRINITY_DN289_c0_g5_i1.p1  ORF type:complete len:218 (-),score=66.52 TRINITY_DN289_c0_g5_i1:90-743(-)
MGCCSCLQGILRTLLLILNIVLLLGSLGLAIAFSVIVYTNDWNEVLGSFILIIVLCFLGVVFFFSIIGCCAAKSKNKCLLAIFTGLLLILFLGAIALAAGSFVLADNVEGENLSTIAEGWSALVEADPESACSIQDELDCSGFYESCAQKPDQEYCPRCDQPPSSTPCVEQLPSFIEDILRIQGYCLFGFSAFLLAICIFYWLLCCRPESDSDYKRV